MFKQIEIQISLKALNIHRNGLLFSNRFLKKVYIFQIMYYVWLVLIGASLALAAEEDYCTTKLCLAGVTHVACNVNKGFSSNCSTDAMQVDLTSGPLQQLILDRHNMRRWQVAQGVLTGFPTAAKMQEMVTYLFIHYSVNRNVKVFCFL